jgi:hypothetical protein
VAQDRSHRHDHETAALTSAHPVTRPHQPHQSPSPSSRCHVRLPYYASHLRNHIYPLLGNRRMGTITRSEIQAFVSTVSGKVAPSTTETVYAVLRAMMQHVVTIPSQVSDIKGGEPACRPGSVRPLARGGGHPSGTAVAGSLVRSTRKHRAGRPRSLAQGATGSPLDLAPGGVYRAAAVTCGAGGLLHHRFTLTPADAGAV